MRNGVYRGIIERTDGMNIVFNFEILAENRRQVLYIINGEERMLVDQIEEQNDSVIISLPFYESSFRVKVSDDGDLHGSWIKKLAERDQVLPFSADYNNPVRFITEKPTKFNVEGRWAVEFSSAGKNSMAVGEFRQLGSKVTGSFLTNDGDYRFLEGVVSSDSLILSGFDGGFAVLFTAKVNSNNTLTNGKLFSGARGKSDWKATKDENAELDDEYAITRMREGKTSLSFSFEDIDGKKVSISDPRYRNKIVIIQILGSWCPNCIDETRYLISLYEKYHKQGVEFIALAYERTTDRERSIAALQRLRDRLKIPYTILWTGVTSSDAYLTEKTLPEVEKIKVFPTSIVVDHKGTVRTIHTGFSGPGTGMHYEEHKKKYESMLKDLIAEKKRSNN